MMKLNLLARWRNARRYWYLVRTFRNGWGLARRFRRGQPSDRAVLRDGTEVVHPPARNGLIHGIWEVWYEEAYTRNFYTPAAGDVVLDLGANIGLFSAWLARRYPACRVIAFEPAEENYQMLQRNLAGFGVRNVVAHQLGLGGTAGFGVMQAGARSLDDQLRPAAGGEPGAVPVVPFAEAVRLADAERVALCKIDIEGGEQELFAHADAAALGRVDRYVIEYHDHLRPGTLDVIRGRLADTHDLTVRPDGDSGCGLLFAVRRGAT
jgi:FkbM family methyltransferase